MTITDKRIYIIVMYENSSPHQHNMCVHEDHQSVKILNKQTINKLKGNKYKMTNI